MPVISEADARRIAEEWIDAWNRHDLDAIVDHYADDVVSISPLAVERLGVADGAVRGKDQLRDYFARGIAPGSTLHFELQRVLTSIDGMAIYYTRENGKHCIDVMTFNDAGKVVAARVFYG
jgi:ketosteroid isomerase-like protein